MINTMRGSPATGGCTNEGVKARGSCNGILLSNECGQTRPYHRGCDMEAVCKPCTRLLRDANTPRPDCGGGRQQGGVFIRDALTHEGLLWYETSFIFYSHNTGDSKAHA